MSPIQVVAPHARLDAVEAQALPPPMNRPAIRYCGIPASHQPTRRSPRRCCAGYATSRRAGVVRRLAGREGRVPVGAVGAVGVEGHAPGPAHHAQVEAEQGSRVAPGEEHDDEAASAARTNAAHRTASTTSPVARGAVAAGGTAVVLDRTQRDDAGYLMTDATMHSKRTYALASDSY